MNTFGIDREHEDPRSAVSGEGRINLRIESDTEPRGRVTTAGDQLRHDPIDSVDWHRESDTGAAARRTENGGVDT